jgi:hypothetical protein
MNDESAAFAQLSAAGRIQLRLIGWQQGGVDPLLRRSEISLVELGTDEVTVECRRRCKNAPREVTG